MIYHVSHTTRYQYTEPVSLCHNEAHLSPRDCPGQTCQQSDLEIQPRPAVLTNRSDYFGNPATYFTIQEPHRELTVTATYVVEVAPRSVPRPNCTPRWEEVRDLLPRDRSPSVLEAYQFVFDSPYVKCDPQFAAYAATAFTEGRPLLDAVLDLTGRIHAEFHYDPKATTVATPLPEMFAKRRGVCQDFAHLAIACLRSLGLAARYVSGYLCTAPPPGQPRLVGADASHAWLSVYCPTSGWIDVDPTNNQLAGDKHILLAWGRDFADVSPIKGVILGGGHHSVRVTVDVVPLPDSVRGEGGA
jgi:transglutaminase-like putative cysteine protease